MIYVMSDLHGCYDKFVGMLDLIHFTDSDRLYILGDFCDRGKDGIRILTDCMKQNNIVPLLGNHDASAGRFLPVLMNHKPFRTDSKTKDDFDLWMNSDGGDVTVEQFMQLSPPEQKEVLRYLDSFLPFCQITVNGKVFFLAHSVPEKHRLADIGKCRIQDFYLGEPEYEKVYFKDKYCVTGHTPTGFINPSMKGKILQMNRHIALDCGAVFGNPLGCICLDTMQEFYIS